jgi:hypothetical protein
MRVGSFDLNKTFAANWLITTSCPVEIWRVRQETDRAVLCSFVKSNLKLLTVDKRIMGKLYLLGAQVSGGCIAGAYT